MATRKTTPKKPTPVKATKHDKDTRTNIPTAELEKFAEEDEKRPTTLLYPRDPSLDPQLVWKGKDEQDSANLEVPAVPVYIQETIESQAIIEDLRLRSKQKEPQEPQLFADSFGDLKFEERVDFYRHSGKWTNRMILGDSLLVMASLAEKEGLKGQVQMIYVDPPYGIKFGANWQVSTRKRDVVDGKAEDAVRQPEQVRAFRDTWEFGVDSYLAYLRDRFVLARDLLTDSGSIFVQINDERVHLVRSLLDEVFGSQNFVSQISFTKTSGSTTAWLPTVGDYLLWYGRDVSSLKARKLFLPSKPGQPGATEYRRVELSDGEILPISRFRRADGEVDLPQGARVFTTDSIVSKGGDDPDIDLVWDDKQFRLSCKPNRHWKVGVDGTRVLWQVGRLLRQEGLRIYKRYFDDFPYRELVNVWTDTRGEDDPVYVVQTDTKVLERCILMATDPGDLVLDPTCGSGTTAFVAEQHGRRWITTDTSRVSLSLARSRLMSAKFPYYLLADSAGGSAKEGELAGAVLDVASHSEDIRKGFVYERVSHITLGGIAHNPDLREGMAREDIDAAITRHADTEVLYDRPYEDKKIVRVTGPFTVESLSPHRVNIDGPEDEPASAQALGVDSARFIERIVEELRAAGVQNTYKGEKLVFDLLEPFAGVYVQATGTYHENGKAMTAAVALGPEYGTVGKELVREAAKEAAEFADILIVCGFAFEALVEEESKVGKLRILKAKMNPDLQMPDLLKKTGAGNLFMVFGEPDVDVAVSGDRMVTVEIRGLDVYDPTTGQVRSGGTDDIACWFIDTDYNEETFFVRHAYFCGGDQPYEKLQRVLKADIDETTWATLYSTKSRPFPRPSTGKVGIKVINHYGDEILKVYQV